MNIEDLEAKDEGRPVIYHGYHGKERGVISSWNNKLVFVKFESNTAACYPKHLSFVVEAKE
jgi:hypothetical protein